MEEVVIRVVCIESPGSVMLAGIEPVVLIDTSSFAHPRDLSTAPPSPLRRCVAHLHKLCEHTYVFQFFQVYLLTNIHLFSVPQFIM